MLEKYVQLLEQIKTDKQELNNRVLIVDGLNFFIRSWSVVPEVNDNGAHVGGLTGFLRSLAYVVRQFNPMRCVIVFDGVGGSVRRRKIYPEYKAQRISKINLNRTVHLTSSPEDEEEQLKYQISRLYSYLKTLPVTVISLDGIEADDTISYIVTRLLSEKEHYIVSSDKDFLQLVNNRIRVWSPTKKKLYSEAEVQAEYLVSSKNFLYYKILTGDKSDNIFGIKGLGPKTIVKRLPFLVEDREATIDEIIAHCKEKKEEAAIYDKIILGEEILKRNYQLMQLKDVDISGDLKMKIADIISHPVSGLNTIEFRKAVIFDKIMSFKNVESFFGEFYILDSFTSKF